MPALLILLMLAASLPSLEAGITYVDLSHIQSNRTLAGDPASPPYELTLAFAGDYVPGTYIELNIITTPEHLGTHMDVPSHFVRGGRTLDQVPLADTIAEGVVIDCSREAAQNREYGVPVQKIIDWERRYGRIPQQAAVLFNFGWYFKYDDEQDFRGTDNVLDQLTYKFPYITFEAYKFLQSNRDLKIIGTDTMSVDPTQINGTPSTFPVHVDFLTLNRTIVEQLRDLHKLPPRGFMFHASPVKYAGATGAPVRAVGVVRSPYKGFGSVPYNRRGPYDGRH